MSLLFILIHLEMSLLDEAEDFLDSIEEFSTEEKIHVKKLLDRAAISPNIVLKSSARYLRGVISRNPLEIAGNMMTYSVLFLV